MLLIGDNKPVILFFVVLRLKEAANGSFLFFLELMSGDLQDKSKTHSKKPEATGIQARINGELVLFRIKIFTGGFCS